VGELAVPFEISQPAVSRHLRVLEHAGMVSSGAERGVRKSAERLTELLEAGI
jgi:DNA-binding transcriptional ArsR family regulator